MSKLTIRYMDRQKDVINVTGYDIAVSPHFLKIRKKEDEILYIPLCVIKNLTIEGYKIIKGE